MSRKKDVMCSEYDEEFNDFRTESCMINCICGNNISLIEKYNVGFRFSTVFRIKCLKCLKIFEYNSSDEIDNLVGGEIVYDQIIEKRKTISKR